MPEPRPLREPGAATRPAPPGPPGRGPVAPGRRRSRSGTARPAPVRRGTPPPSPDPRPPAGPAAWPRPRAARRRRTGTRRPAAPAARSPLPTAPSSGPAPLCPTSTSGLCSRIRVPASISRSGDGGGAAPEGDGDGDHGEAEAEVFDGRTDDAGAEDLGGVVADDRGTGQNAVHQQLEAGDD